MLHEYITAYTWVLDSSGSLFSSNCGWASGIELWIMRLGSSDLYNSLSPKICFLILNVCLQKKLRSSCKSFIMMMNLERSSSSMGPSW